jgi:hypothetical protein
LTDRPPGTSGRPHPDRRDCTVQLAHASSRGYRVAGDREFLLAAMPPASDVTTMREGTPLDAM